MGKEEEGKIKSSSPPQFYFSCIVEHSICFTFTELKNDTFPHKRVLHGHSIQLSNSDGPKGSGS